MADQPDLMTGEIIDDRPLRVVLAEDGDLVRAGVLALLERFPSVPSSGEPGC